MADTSPKDSATTALPGGAHIVHVHGVDMVLFSSGIAIPLPPHQEVATNATGDTTDTNTNTDSSPTSGGKATRFLVDGFEVVQQDDGFTTVDVPGAGLRLVKAPGQGPVAVVRIEVIDFRGGKWRED